MLSEGERRRFRHLLPCRFSPPTLYLSGSRAGYVRLFMVHLRAVVFPASESDFGSF